MKLTVNDEEMEVTGIKGILLSIVVYIFSVFAVIWTLLVTFSIFAAIALVLLSPLILIVLVISWAL